MTEDQIIGAFGIALGANALTIGAVYAMVQIAKADREQRENGQKVPVPPVYYFCIVGPALLAAACLYYIS